ncbi:hypothetical protein KZ770_22770 [Escherichia coli]|nr:hypothetical protein [Escherichia coli]
MAENDPGRNNDSQLSSAASRTAGKTGGIWRNWANWETCWGKAGSCWAQSSARCWGKTGKSLKSIANKVIRWVTDPVDPVTGAYCDERTDFTSGQTLPLSFTRFHSSVLPLHGLTGVGWSDSRANTPWVREQGNRVDIISSGSHAELRLRR